MNATRVNVMVKVMIRNEVIGQIRSWLGYFEIKIQFGTWRHKKRE